MPDPEMVTDERKGKERKESPGRVEITWRPSEHDERLARCDEMEPKPKLIVAIERELLPQPWGNFEAVAQWRETKPETAHRRRCQGTSLCPGF